MSRFARSSKNCDFSCVAKNRKSDDFSQFFVLFIITKPDRVAKIAKNRKFDDFSRHLRFLAVLCHVNVHFSRVHDHLKKPFADFTKFAISPKSFRFTCHFGISLSAQLKHIYSQKPTQLIFE